MEKITTYVDASYAVHQDIKSHTGGAISLGTGAVMRKSSKQKLNTKSSMEAELVGASDYLPNTIWLKYFLEEQGYRIQENTFMQDNQSAMKLEMNGRKSCGQKSRHIDIRYFFIKDRFENDNIKVIYCPTEAMLADFFTKPLQGTLFKRLREVIMGRVHLSTLKKFVTPKERVGNSIISGNNNDGVKNIINARNCAKDSNIRNIEKREGIRTNTKQNVNHVKITM
jgi:ribosomal protein S18